MPELKKFAGQEPAKCENVPMKSGLPHIAYILLWYPLFTQPFIFREVETLRKILPLQTYTLYGKNLRHCSEEMIRESSLPVRFGSRTFLQVLWGLLVTAFCKPGRFFSLFRKNCCRRWANLEIFGENLWAFCVGVTLARRFKEDGIDLIYAPWPRGTATAASVASALSGLPFAMAARGDNLSPADPDFGDKLEDAIFIRANNVADQKRIKAFDKGQASEKTVLVYNGLTLHVPEKLKNDKCKSVPISLLALGRFDVTKGFDVLLRACAILKAKGIKFHLTLAGGGGKLMGLGNLENELRELRSNLGLEDDVSMPGLLSHDELPDILESNDIFAAPCVIHESGRRDGIPNTVIEAMAFGMPIVATSVNALPEVVRNGKTGLIVPPNDPQALADAIVWYVEHPDAACQIGKNASLLAREMFDPCLNARKLASIFINAEKEVEKRCAV